MLKIPKCSLTPMGVLVPHVCAHLTWLKKNTICPFQEFSFFQICTYLSFSMFALQIQCLVLSAYTDLEAAFLVMCDYT